MAFVDIDLVVSSDLWRYAGKAARGASAVPTRAARGTANSSSGGGGGQRRGPDRKTAWVLPGFYIRSGVCWRSSYLCPALC